jgi:hypothetical protein
MIALSSREFSWSSSSPKEQLLAPRRDRLFCLTVGSGSIATAFPSASIFDLPNIVTFAASASDAKLFKNTTHSSSSSSSNGEKDENGYEDEENEGGEYEVYFVNWPMNCCGVVKKRSELELELELELKQLELKLELELELELEELEKLKLGLEFELELELGLKLTNTLGLKLMYTCRKHAWQIQQWEWERRSDGVKLDQDTFGKTKIPTNIQKQVPSHFLIAKNLAISFIFFNPFLLKTPNL